jgi:hypothetical protein
MKSGLFDIIHRDRRPESRGFALDSNNEEDSFSGDGLEREKRWLDHFRERRGPRSSRSGPKDSSSSSKDSSRYSFSTEFSSGIFIETFPYDLRLKSFIRLKKLNL